MTAFATAAAGPLRADPSKRVNYTLGLVLGVDEFQQDQFYHTANRRWHNRLLHGYGTVWGLRVSTPEPGEADPEIRVTEGVAVDPCGREICVPDTMCVRLNSWLDRHRAVLQRLYGAGPATIPLAVVLCHRECPDDVVPVPGEPCRSQEDAMQPSRIRESFELRLALRDEAPWDSPPGDNAGGLALFRFSQPEEEAVRAFGRLLDRVRVECRDVPPGGRAALVAAVRELAAHAEWAEAGSPPEALGWILLDEDEADAAVREAIRVWATEVRPRVRGREPVRESCGCPTGADDCCVLLAEIDLPVSAAWVTGGDPFPAIEERRPVLLHTRLLQEWLARGGEGCCCAEVDTFVTAAPIATDTVRVWLHHEAPLSLPADAVTVIVNGGAPVAPGTVTSLGGMDNAFDVVLSPGAADGDTVELRFDLAQITEADSTPAPIGGDCPTGGFLDRSGPTVSAFVVFREQSAVLPPLGGDASGPMGANTVVAIRGVPVAAQAPAASQVLTFSAGAWRPAAVPAAALPAGTTDVSGTYPALTVVRIQTRPVANTAPTNGQVLAWNGAAWAPASAPAPALPPGTTDVSGTYPALTVTRIQAQPVSNVAPTAVGQVLTWNGAQWAAAGLPPFPAAAGDVTGAIGATTVARLQGRNVSAAAPANNQVLTWNGAQWVPANVPAAAVPNAGGDATGAITNLTVTRIQTRPVSSAAPTAAGQVLTWNGAQWEAAAPAGGGGTLAGDVTGPAGDNTLQAIQERRVDAPDPSRGQALVFDGDAWRPEFVVRAVNEPYSIVAGGNFARDGSPLGATYNGTTVQVTPRVGTSILDLRVTFGGFDPGAGDRLVVKGTVQDSRSVQARPLVFLEVRTAGVLLAANTAGLEQADRIILEISRIG